MQPSRTIGFAAFVTLFVTVSLFLAVRSTVVFSASPTSAQTPEDPRQAQAEQLYQQGIKQYQQGQLEAAIESWQKALPIYQQLQNRQRTRAVVGTLGATYLMLGDSQKAIEFSEQFLTLAKEMGDRSSIGQALGNLGMAYKGIGEYVKAIEFHQEALAIMRELKNRQGEGRVLGNLGSAFEGLGDYEKAIASYQESLTISREINDRLGEGTALGKLGAMYANLGEYDKALESYKESLSVVQAIGDALGEGYTLRNLGIAQQVQGDLTQAIESFTKALSIAQDIGDRKLEAETLGSLGLAYEDKRDFSQAIEHQQQSLAITQAIGDRRLEGVALNNLGHALFNSGNLKEAENKLRDAVKVLESLRPGLTDANNVSIFDTQVLTYNLLQQILIAQDKFEAALEISEQGRARAFVELLAKRLSPEAALESAKSKPPTIEQIQEIAKTQQATLVEYSIVPDEAFKVQGKLRGEPSELLIWVVQPTGKVTFRRVDLKFLRQSQKQAADNALTALDELVNTSRILQGPRLRRGEAARKQLHQLLIEPIAEFLPTHPEARVIFIPQESLFLLPFAALQNASGQYLIEKHTILTAPAIQVLDLTHQQRQRLETQYKEPLQGKEVLVVGNPTMPTLKFGETVEQLTPLPGSEEEANAIASLLNTKPLIGNQATKVNIVQQLPKMRVVHLATHGLLDDIKELGVPGAIALAPSENDDGFLTAGEILNLKLNAELVVLSGCHTGQGKITGDGVLGLSRSLITSGVPSAIVSLWAVPDTATALLMTEFYRQLALNTDKAQALRSAMLTTMKQYPQPINWAAFTLIGEASGSG
ncbi:CHAT domain-containing protein [Microcoleus sp. FACHB-SPT15]|uniref:CHAT domain-containing protein n=1 Tax=Microcoleus sp. FACHB-SPT15 TaxID=2692830 RepID=UPI00177BC1A9|nr:CHAT domain-containing tetratricopeptide repeat protein [Microcoleus sp. FACHB-SPT15]MBD1809672.1 CHAT domain-containing protein [Microcoleus sp. FACHB-SPT15]